MKSFWWRLKLFLPWELEESLIWEFKNLLINSYAIETSEEDKSKLALVVWLPSSEWPKREREKLVESIKLLTKTFEKDIDDEIWDKVLDEDWSSTWKKYWEPSPIGQSLLILPAWMSLPEIYKNKIVLKLDPGAAFGTGDHPTTRLCLEALEREPPLNLIVADVGCGSGILGLAALSLGAKEVVGVDIDSMAINSTRTNASLNNLDLQKLRTSLGSIDALYNELQGVKADLLLCNILAPVIKSLAPQFDRVISSKGHAFFSGLLAEQIEDITSVLAGYGWHFVASYQQENWALIHLCKQLNSDNHP